MGISKHNTAVVWEVRHQAFCPVLVVGVPYLHSFGDKSIAYVNIV